MSGIPPHIRRRKHRLPEEAYFGEKTVAITITVVDRKRLFDFPDVRIKCIDVLGAKSKAQRCEVPIYCFMPDHLHILIRGLEEASRPKVAINRFKISTGIWLGAKYPNCKLGHDYHDHIILNSEDWRGQACYIALNPVRKGIVEHPHEYSGTGCIGMDREAMLEEIFFNR